jgi:hypothetical protein
LTVEVDQVARPFAVYRPFFWIFPEAWAVEFRCPRYILLTQVAPLLDSGEAVTESEVVKETVAAEGLAEWMVHHFLGRSDTKVD